MKRKVTNSYRAKVGRGRARNKFLDEVAAELMLRIEGKYKSMQTDWKYPIFTVANIVDTFHHGYGLTRRQTSEVANRALETLHFHGKIKRSVSPGLEMRGFTKVDPDKVYTFKFKESDQYFFKRPIFGSRQADGMMALIFGALNSGAR